MSKTVDLRKLDAQYTRKLNQIATECKTKYTGFVDLYSRKYGNCDWWWATPFACRNDDTFQNFCLFFLCRQIIDSNEAVDCIIVNDKALQKALYINCGEIIREKGIQVKAAGKNIGLFSIAVSICFRVKRVLTEFWQIKRRLRKVKYEIEETFSMIDTPVLSSSFQKGEYKDRYFNNIQKYTDRNIYFLPSLMNNNSMNWKEFAENVKESKDYRFIFKEKFLTWFDFGYLMIYIIHCLLWSGRRYCYEDIDISPLVSLSLLKGAYSVPSYKGILNSRFIKIFRQKKYKVDNLISWWEGRPSEVMLQKAFRKYYPESKCVGYVGLPPMEFLLSLYVSKEQLRQKVCPLKMTIPGAGYERQARQFCQDVKVIRTPILRNDYFGKGQPAEQNGKKGVLVILSYAEDVTCNMIEIINEYMKENQNKFDIYVKNHPVYPNRKIENYLKEEICFTPIYIDGELIHCLRKVDIAFVSYSSSTLEVLSQEKGLIILCPPGKLCNTHLPEGFSCDSYFQAYDKQEVFHALDILDKVDNKSCDLREWLEIVNKETVNRMWE